VAVRTAQGGHEHTATVLFDTNPIVVAKVAELSDRGVG
jgi:hypothetical protein